MQPEVLIAAAGIIVTFILSTWRWSASQNKRFDRVIQELHSQNSKLRDEFRDEFRELRKAINQLDRRLAHQQALIQALWSRIFNEEATTSVPILPE